MHLLLCICFYKGLKRLLSFRLLFLKFIAPPSKSQDYRFLWPNDSVREDYLCVFDFIYEKGLDIFSGVNLHRPADCQRSFLVLLALFSSCWHCFGNPQFFCERVFKCTHKLGIYCFLRSGHAGLSRKFITCHQSFCSTSQTYAIIR